MCDGSSAFLAGGCAFVSEAARQGKKQWSLQSCHTFLVHPSQTEVAHELAELFAGSRSSCGGSMTSMVAVCAILCRRVGLVQHTHGHSLLW